MARIAIDATAFDTVGHGIGQFRYMVDLLRGLRALETRDEFLVVGTGTRAPDDLTDLFASDANWRFVSLAQSKRRGGFYFDQLRWAAWLVEERIDLVHSLHSFIPILSNVPVVATKYDLMIELFPEYSVGKRSRSYRWHRWSARHFARRLIAISQATADDIAAFWRVPTTHVAVVPLGVDFIRGQGNVPSHTSADLTILSPFNLEPRKNLSSLLKAFAIVKSKHTNATLQLFGAAAVTAERNRQYHSLVSELGIATSVMRTGLISSDELAKLYARATLFVFPSLYEGFGLPVLEAMSAGCCVVARGASSMPEILGDTGVLVETNRPDTFAATMIELLNSPDRRAELGKRAQARSLLFTVGRMSSLTYDVYATLLGGGGR